jgi:hypothetical protein
MPEEKTRNTRELSGPNPRGLDLFAPNEPGADLVTVVHGPYAEDLPVGGMSVGEIRARFRDRFDIDPRSQAMLDGVEVGDEVTVRPGMQLFFAKRAGEKGSGTSWSRTLALRRNPPVSWRGGPSTSVAVDPSPEGNRTERHTQMAAITIDGSEVTAVSPEGATATMSVTEFTECLGSRRMDTGDVILADGVKAVLSGGPLTVWVHQTPPRVHLLKWIAERSTRPFGMGAEYRDVRIALPYLITLAVFAPAQKGASRLSGWNECFFRNAPLESMEDQLFYPALLNCSKFAPPEGRPLSWICTQYLDSSSFRREADPSRAMRAAFRQLMSCLLDTGFNYSSEHNELSSWFTESRGCDPRVAVIDRWQEETARDPLFVLEVPWLKTGFNVRQVVDRLLHNHHCTPAAISHSGDLSRIVFNHRVKRPLIPELGL